MIPGAARNCLWIWNENLRNAGIAPYLFSGKYERRAKYSRFVSGGANVIEGESLASFIASFERKSKDDSYLVLGKNLLQFFGHGLDGDFAAAHASGFPDNAVVLLRPNRIEIRIVDAAMRTAAFRAGQRAARDCFGGNEHGLQVIRKVPARIEETGALETSLPPRAF